MIMISVDVLRIPTHGPGDVSGLIRLIEAGKLAPSSIRAVLGKTEGNGGVNDFTREYAVATLCQALSARLKLPPHAVAEKSPAPAAKTCIASFGCPAMSRSPSQPRVHHTGLRAARPK
jgi:ring-opening amidohydrolase-like protein